LQPTTPDSAAFRIVSQATGKALTLSPGSQLLEDGVRVEQWPIDEQTSGQEWGLQLAGYDNLTDSSVYVIFAYLSEKVLDVRGGSTEDHAAIQQYTPNGTPAQLWILQSVEV
jgi:mannan endo-1,4-beta-mannosidase